jgi:serine/threonine protein kinase
MTSRLPQNLIHKLNGKYQLVQLLGSGGMGEVWKVCLHDFPGKVSALKLLPQEEVAAAKSLEEEARNLLRLSPSGAGLVPGIPAFEDFERFDNWLALRTSFVPGVNLEVMRKLLDEVERCPADEKIAMLDTRQAAASAAFDLQMLFGTRYLLQTLQTNLTLNLKRIFCHLFLELAESLAVVHARGLTHGDIKPANILLNSGTESLCLVDWGLSRRFGKASTVLDGWHTARYAPPEQVKATNLSFEDWKLIDQYSFAATMLAVLTGKPPVDSRPIDYGSLDPVIGELLSRALEPNAQKRFSSVGDFRDSLENGCRRMSQIRPRYVNLEVGVIHISDIRISDARQFSEEVAGLKTNLRKEIRLSKTNLNCQQLAELCTATLVQRLEIEECPGLGDDVFELLLNLPNLRRLELKGCQGLSFRGVEAFVKEVKCQHTRKIKLKLDGPPWGIGMDPESIASLGMKRGEFVEIN